MSKLSFLLILVMGFLSLASKCGEEPPERPNWAEVPQGFVLSNESPFVFRAVAPDGTSIGVRHRYNQEEGDLAFWKEVFRLEMVEAKGYRLIETSSLKSKDKVEGVYFQFELAEGAVPYHYGLALFVTKESIVTVESATELESLPKYEEAFAATRASLLAKWADNPEEGP